VLWLVVAAALLKARVYKYPHTTNRTTRNSERLAAISHQPFNAKYQPAVTSQKQTKNTRLQYQLAAIGNQQATNHLNDTFIK